MRERSSSGCLKSTTCGTHAAGAARGSGLAVQRAEADLALPVLAGGQVVSNQPQNRLEQALIRETTLFCGHGYHVCAQMQS